MDRDFNRVVVGGLENRIKKTRAKLNCPRLFFA